MAPAADPSATSSKSYKSVWEVFIAITLLVIAILCLLLFARSIGLLRLPRLDPELDRWAAFVVVLAAAAAPIFLLSSEIMNRWRRRRERADRVGAGSTEPELEDSLLEFTVHFVPYGILALAMLLEHEKLVKADGEGLAAVAAIMILFALAELGLFVFTHILKARRASDGLERALSAATSRLEGLPWVDLHLKLLTAAAQNPGRVELNIAPRIRVLFDAYADFLDPNGTQQDRLPMSRHLSRALLSEYLREEYDDFTGRLKAASVPSSIRPPFELKNGDRVAYFATNVGFYANYLAAAVEVISQEARAQERVPCIGVITNALPSAFWNWPDGGSGAFEYPPIAEYRDAQIRAVRQHDLKIFRVVLVAEEEGSGTDLNWCAGTLSTAAEWSRQQNWDFVCAKGSAEPLKRKECSGVPEPAFTQSHVAEYDYDIYAIIDKAHWPDAHKGHYELEPVWRSYCRQFHSGGSSGGTVIAAVTKTQFQGQLPTGLNGYSDCMFLGSVPRTEVDLWSSKSDPQWSLAILSSMSSVTQTMFLSVFYSKAYVERFWADLRQARGLITRVLANSS